MSLETDRQTPEISEDEPSNFMHGKIFKFFLPHSCLHVKEYSLEFPRSTRQKHGEDMAGWRVGRRAQNEYLMNF